MSIPEKKYTRKSGERDERWATFALFPFPGVCTETLARFVAAALPGCRVFFSEWSDSCSNAAAARAFRAIYRDG